MESDILTGRKINEAKNNTSDEALEALLKSAQSQIDRDMGESIAPKETASIGEKNTQLEEAERKKAEQERYKKLQEKRTEEARLEQQRLSREKADRERKAREQAERERVVQEREEKRKKLEQEKAEKEHADEEKRRKLEQEKAEMAARREAEKAKREQEARAAQEKAERERFVREQAEKERVGKELAAYDKESEGKNQNTRFSGDAMEKDTPQGNTQRIDILVNGNKGATGNRRSKATNKETAATIDITDDVIVDNSVPAPIRKEGITVVDVIGGFFEFIWTLFKLAVVISIVTAIVGFFLSREMLIRGRNGHLKCLDTMVMSQTTMGNKDAEEDEVSEWRLSAKPQKLTLESDDGYILVAREVIINKDNNNWAVIIHGYNGDMEDIYDIARHYTKEGYNVLMPDLRASGESEGSFIGMGWLDRLDVINWIDVILDDYPSANVVIHGVDMGGDTGLMISGEPIKSNIKAIVADGAYTSAWEVLKPEFKTRHEDWPVFPLMEMINPVAKVWGGYTLREADAVKQVEKTSVPILLIQGGQDTYVTKDMADELNAAVASSHKLVTIPYGMHGDCRYADPDTYYKEVFDFLELHVR